MERYIVLAEIGTGAIVLPILLVALFATYRFGKLAIALMSLGVILGTFISTMSVRDIVLGYQSGELRSESFMALGFGLAALIITLAVYVTRRLKSA